MKICDFCTAAKIILDFVAVGKSISQLDFMYDLFKDFKRLSKGRICYKRKCMCINPY